MNQTPFKYSDKFFHVLGSFRHLTFRQKTFRRRHFGSLDISAHVRIGTADISTHGRYGTGLFRHRDISARGTFRHVDVSAPWTFRHMDVSARWTFWHRDFSALDVSARVFWAHFSLGIFRADISARGFFGTGRFGTGFSGTLFSIFYLCAVSPDFSCIIKSVLITDLNN